MKRVFDLTCIAIAAPIIVPVIALLAGLVRIFLGKPIWFRQQRPGYKGRVFTLVKFRTMTLARDSKGNLLPDIERMTSFGRWLRSTSLDELPEVWNVLKGEMSLVGPRPLLVQYLPRYTTRQMRRHDVLPGITGLAQVAGRNGLSWDEKFELDLQYVKCKSMGLDLKILCKTVLMVAQQKNVTASQSTTMPEFEGSDSEKAN